MRSIDLIEKKDETPLCPHCSAELTALWTKRVDSQFGKRFIYFCPFCRKVLGLSHRKGFWMG